jgi:signal transduction histidine kinase
VLRSLAARIVLVIALVQASTVVLGMAGWMLFSPYVNWSDVAHRSAADLVIADITDAGRPVIAAGARLSTYAASRPGFEYAALAEGVVLDGSSTELAGLVTSLGSSLPRKGQLENRTTDGRRVRVTSLPSPIAEAQEITVVTAGDRFRAEDLAAFLRHYLPQLVPIFGPALLAAAIAVPLAVRLALRPLTRASLHLSRVGVRSLDVRLPDAGTPSELAPFVASINELLARLEEGVARQRLFTANAAHELRTPVAILQARVDALPDPVESRQDLLRDVRRVTVLLDQLLTVARLGQRAGGIGEEVDLAALARRVVADCAPLAIRAGRQLAVELSGDPPVIAGEAQAIEGALTALVENALRAEPVGGVVTVIVGAGPHLRVVDHGGGIAPEVRGLVFEPFWRGETGTRGTGLGLAIVSEVARLHGGTASVQETPGGGATFALHLPGLPCAPRHVGASLSR